MRFSSKLLISCNKIRYLLSKIVTSSEEVGRIKGREQIVSQGKIKRKKDYAKRIGTIKIEANCVLP